LLTHTTSPVQSRCRSPLARRPVIRCFSLRTPHSAIRNAPAPLRSRLASGPLPFSPLPGFRPFSAFSAVSAVVVVVTPIDAVLCVPLPCGRGSAAGVLPFAVVIRHLAFSIRHWLGEPPSANGTRSHTGALVSKHPELGSDQGGEAQPGENGLAADRMIPPFQATTILTPAGILHRIESAHLAPSYFPGLAFT